MCADILGKTNRSPFHNQAQHTQEAPSAPLDIIATDMTGPINSPDSKGNRYLQLLVNIHTGLMRGELMKSKRQAATVILQHI